MLRRRPGLTLIEILVVIVVLAVLATLVAPSIFQHVSTAKELLRGRLPPLNVVSPDTTSR